MIDERVVNQGVRFFATNSTSTDALAAPAILTAPPTLGSGYLALAQVSPTDSNAPPKNTMEGRGPASLRNVVIVPVGTNANNETFAFSLIGYRRYQLATGAYRWVGIPFGQFNVTLGATATGETDEYFADTIAAVANTDVGEYRIEGNATGLADYVARVVLTDTEGVEYLRLITVLNGGSPAASANAILWME